MNIRFAESDIILKSFLFMISSKLWGTIGAKLSVKKEKVLIRTNVYGVSGKQKPRI